MHPAVKNGSYDVAKIRADFPALAMQVYGKPLVYLDNAASAQKPTQVLERLQKAYTTEYANVHRGLHFLANEATEAYEAARATVRAFLNASRNEESFARCRAALAATSSRACSMTGTTTQCCGSSATTSRPPRSCSWRCC